MNVARNDSVLFFDTICGARSPFWDSSLSWDTSSPDLTICFIKIVPVWLSCAILWLSTALVCLFLPRKRRKRDDNENFISDAKFNDQLQSFFALEISFVEFMRRWRGWSILFVVKIVGLAILSLLTIIGKRT